MGAKEPRLYGLLHAKSPLFALNKINGFLAALRVLVSDGTTAEVALLVMASSSDTLSKHYLDTFKLNEFIRITEFHASKVALGQSNKRYVYVLRIGKEAPVAIIGESELRPCLDIVPECQLSGTPFTPIAYEGTVTQVIAKDVAELDGKVIVVGLSEMHMNQTLCLLNIFPAPPSSAYVQSFDEKSVPVYIFCPFYSNVSLNGHEKPASSPKVYPNFACKHVYGLLKTHLEPIDALQCITEVSAILWQTSTIAAMFINFLDGNTEYFEETSIGKIALIEDSPSEHLGRDNRIAIGRNLSRNLIIGRVLKCPVTGLLKIKDLSGNAFIASPAEDAISPGQLLVIKEYDVVSENFLVDPSVGKCAARSYILPIVYQQVSDKNALKSPQLESGRSYFVLVIESASPLEVAILKPFRMESRISGTLLCLMTKDTQGELVLKKLSKKVTLTVGPDGYTDKLRTGAFAVVSHGKTSSAFTLHSPVSIELDAHLDGKGESKWVAECLNVAPSVFKYLIESAPKVTAPVSLRSLKSTADQSGSFDFKAIVKEIRLHLKYENTPGDPKLLRIYASHQVGLPVPFAQIELVVREVDASDEKQFRVRYDLMNAKCMPLGLLPGCLIEGRSFSFANEIVESGATSLITVLSTGQTPSGTDIDIELPSDLPFHYLADFYGYEIQYPGKPLTIECNILELKSVLMKALCSRCKASAVLQYCCPIHGKLDSSEIQIDAQLTCIITDGTYEAELQLRGLDYIIELLGIKRDAVISFCAQAGRMEMSSILLMIPSMDSIILQRFRVEGICVEAMPKVPIEKAVMRNIRFGRASGQGYSYPGRVLIRARRIQILDPRTVALRCLELLAL